MISPGSESGGAVQDEGRDYPERGHKRRGQHHKEGVPGSVQGCDGLLISLEDDGSDRIP